MSSTFRIAPAGHTEHAFSAVLNEGREDEAVAVWPDDGIFEIGSDDMLTIRVLPGAEQEPAEPPASTDAADPAPVTTDAAQG